MKSFPCFRIYSEPTDGFFDFRANPVFIIFRKGGVTDEVERQIKSNARELVK
jgi:hypothetical protein